MNYQQNYNKIIYQIYKKCYLCVYDYNEYLWVIF